jgi:hypothetical protein
VTDLPDAAEMPCMAAPTLSAASERDADPHFAYSLVN